MSSTQLADSAAALAKTSSVALSELSFLHGLHNPLVTPFTADGEVHEATLRALVQRNIAKQLKGLYVCGTIGEGLLLSVEERKEVFRIIAEEANGSQTLIAHVGALSTRDAIVLAQSANEYEYHAISSIPPFYFLYNFEETKAYYSDIAGAVDLPLLIYNAPDYEGVHFSFEQMCELLEIPGVVGIKNSSADIYMVARLREARPDTIFLHSYEHLLLSVLPFGVHGAIGSHLNLIPEVYQRMVGHFDAGRLHEAWEEQATIIDVYNLLMGVGEIPAIKAIFGMIGLDCGLARKPHRQLDAATLNKLEKAVQRHRIT